MRKLALDNQLTIKQEIANLAKFARECSGLSQIELAERLGLSQARISQIENGTHDTSLCQIASVISECGGEISLNFDHPLLQNKTH